MSTDTLQDMINDFSENDFISEGKSARRVSWCAEGGNRVLDYLGVKSKMQNKEFNREGSQLIDVLMVVNLKLLERIEKLEEDLYTVTQKEEV